MHDPFRMRESRPVGANFPAERMSDDGNRMDQELAKRAASAEITPGLSSLTGPMSCSRPGIAGSNLPGFAPVRE